MMTDNREKDLMKLTVEAFPKSILPREKDLCAWWMDSLCEAYVASMPVDGPQEIDDILEDIPTDVFAE